MANVTNPFDLLNSFDKKSDWKKAKPAAPGPAANGAAGETAAQKKRRNKKEKRAQQKQAEAESGAEAEVETTEPEAEQAQEQTPLPPQEASGFTAADYDANGWLHGIPPELLYDEPVKKEEEFRVVSRQRHYQKHAQEVNGSAPASSQEPQSDPPRATQASSQVPAPNSTHHQDLTFGSANSGMHTAPTPVQPGEPGVPEAIAQQARDLEEAARGSWSWPIASRCQQWKQWCSQAQMGTAGNIPWKQVFLCSQALELTLQGCLDPPVTSEQLPDLQALLRTFLGSSEAALSAAQVTLDLAQVVGSQPGHPSDPALLKSAQDALGAAVSCIKKSMSGWAVRSVADSLRSPTVQHSLANLNNSAAGVEGQLRQFDAGGAGGDVSGAASSDKASCYKDLATIGEKRLSTLLGAISAATAAKAESGDMEAQAEALKRVRSLTSLILQRKREGPAPLSSLKSASAPVQVPAPVAAQKGGKGKGGGKANGEEASKEDEAELKKSLAAAESELTSARKELEEAEKTVARLREICVKAEVKHRDLQQRLFKNQTPAAGLPSAAPAQSGPESVKPPSVEGSLGLPPGEQHQLQCARQLGTVHALETMLLRRPIAADVPADSMPQTQEEAAVWGVVGQAVTEHLSALSQLLQTQMSSLQGAGQRLRFCQEKRQKIKDDMKTYRDMGRKQMADSLSKPLESAEALYKVRLGEVDVILREAEKVESALHQPDLRTAVALLPLMPPVHLLLQQIGTTLHQIRKEHAALMEPLPAIKAGDSGKGTKAPPPAQAQHSVPETTSQAALVAEKGQQGRGVGAQGGKGGKGKPVGGGVKVKAQGQTTNGMHGDADTAAEGVAPKVQVQYENPTKTAWQKPTGSTAPVEE